MRSPFPGMDPYLEDPRYWPDFHQRFVTYWCDALTESLPSHYEARMEDRLSVVTEIEDKPHMIRPDVTVSVTGAQRGPAPQTGAKAEGALAVLEPVTLPLAVVDEIRQPRITLHHGKDRRLVGVLELLSPSNKAGRDGYHAKRNAVLDERVHLIELDLLVGGERMPLGEALPPGDYYVYIARGNRRPWCDVYAWALRDRLPAIRIPLLAPDPDLVFDLAALFQTAYEKGRYARALDYAAPPPAPLKGPHLEWATQTARALKA